MRSQGDHLSRSQTRPGARGTAQSGGKCQASLEPRSSRPKTAQGSGEGRPVPWAQAWFPERPFSVNSFSVAGHPKGHLQDLNLDSVGGQRLEGTGPA